MNAVDEISEYLERLASAHKQQGRLVEAERCKQYAEALKLGIEIHDHGPLGPNA